MRNLDAAEIVGQVMAARDALGEWPSPKDDRQLTNIVLMGMGEPLYNYEHVAAAVKIVLDNEGLSVSRRKITLSTAGVVPMMQRCGEELAVNLAVSLHAVTDELRDVLVPLNKKYPLAELMAACRTYPGATNARRITFEYVMLKGVNDSPAEAQELVRLIAGIPAKVNLIPFNPWPGAPFECSTARSIAAFADIVNEAGYPSPVRTPRGRDILAACGQLKSDSVKLQQERTAEARGRGSEPVIQPSTRYALKIATNTTSAADRIDLGAQSAAECVSASSSCRPVRMKRNVAARISARPPTMSAAPS